MNMFLYSSVTAAYVQWRIKPFTVNHFVEPLTDILCPLNHSIHHG